RDAARLPTAFGSFDRLSLAATLVALIWWVVVPPGPIAGSLVAIVAVLNLVRLARWQGGATRTEPLLWVLHLGYLWIPVGLAMLALVSWRADVSQTAALHALTIGAIGTMTLAVMSRATLGHTGQPLRAGAGLTLAFLLMTAAVILRIAASLWSGLFTPFIFVAAVAWVAAFLFYLGVCGPLLVKRH
ncbi:MAG: NnrS family protein, partial [Alphaproteobacteria bacterium]|nr:NnrS family protein [Alphaproteobacteria bacterium]